jgi:type IV pilus assembly protein PilZ
MSGLQTSSNSKLPIVPLRFKNVNQLYKSFMPWLKNGGLFIPTNKRFEMGQEVLLMVNLPEMIDKLPAAGVVAWVCPKDVTGHNKPGVGIEFTDEEGFALRLRIEGMLVEQMKTQAPTYTL